MRIISEKNLCENRPYINLKKLTNQTALRVGCADEFGLKCTYIINQHTESLYDGNNYSVEYKNGIEKNTFYTEELNDLLLVEVNYSCKTGDTSGKFKVYVVLNNIKYALPVNSFEDVYRDCLNILSKELAGSNDLIFIEKSFKNIEKEERNVDIDLNLQRLSEFKDKVNYKRNVNYFVINNITSATSKYDIKNKFTTIDITDRIKVLRYDYRSRLYNFVKRNSNNITVTLKETDIICDLGSSKDYPTVSIYTNYGLGKLLDIKNNVIPNNNTISLFANLLDLGLDIL